MQQMTLDNLFAQPQRISAYDRLMEAKAEGRRAMEAVAENSGPDFQHKAYEFCANFFRERGQASSEDATDACVASGIVPHDTKAFGPVYQRLIRDKVIRFNGYCARRKGHGTRGGSLYVVCE
jgi:hypothetical protein